MTQTSRTARRSLDGVLLLDKPAGITSQTAVTRAKKAFRAAKAGHTGTLDPMATGLLPIALGEATKFSHVALEADKRYLATVRLGVTTTTGDLEGDVIRRSPVDVDAARIARALDQFRGEITQTPPMYSALKHAGKPLYEYARAGQDVVRAARPVTIRALAVEGYADGELRISVTCTKGTYIRVLAEDIGRTLGCGGCLAALRRTLVGRFALNEAITLEDLEATSPVERDAYLLPADALLAALPALHLTSEQAGRVMRGQMAACVPEGPTGTVRIYAPGHSFLGMAEVDGSGHLKPRRLVATKPVNA